MSKRQRFISTYIKEDSRVPPKIQLYYPKGCCNDEIELAERLQEEEEARVEVLQRSPVLNPRQGEGQAEPAQVLELKPVLCKLVFFLLFMFSIIISFYPCLCIC